MSDTTSPPVTPIDRRSVNEAPNSRLPTDLASIQRTIDEARGLRTVPLTMAALANLERQLCGHIALLLPCLRAAAERLRPHSTAGYLLRSRIEAIEQQAKQGLGEGTLAAHVQVTQLARDCQWLLEQHRAAEPR